MENKYLAKYELSAADSGILYLLSTGEAMNQLSIGQELGIDKATIVKIIDKLESFKFVKREVDTRDRRAKLVTLTPKGVSLLEKVRESRIEVEQEIFKHFSKEDEKELRRLVPLLLETLTNVVGSK